MKGNLLWFAFFAAAAGVFWWLGAQGMGLWQISKGWSLSNLLLVVFAILTGYEVGALGVRTSVRVRRGATGEVTMLVGLLRVVAGIALLLAAIASMGWLGTIGGVAAGFAGLLLGWSLQAPVSGMAAWALITLKRPFRVGDRVLVPSLGLSGDVMEIGVMYTRLNQVGGTIGSEEAIGRSILIPNAMLFTQVVINYTPQQEAAQFLDEVIVRITFDSDWDTAEEILLGAAREATAEIIAKTGQQPYIRSDNYDYGIYMRLRYMTEAMDRPRITHEITKRIFQAFQRNPKVDLAIPYVYSYRKSATEQRFQFPDTIQQPEEIAVADVVDEAAEPLAPDKEAQVVELAARISDMGLLQPIVVARQADGRCRILAGEDRFRACKRLGWTRIPAIVKPEAT